MQPTKPTMLYDGDCGFCQRWIERWRRKTGDRVIYLPYQSAAAQFPQVTEAECRRAVQLIMPNGTVVSAAHAVFHTLAFAGRYGTLLGMYEHLPPFAWAAEVMYQLVAHHRVMLSKGPGRTCRL